MGASLRKPGRLLAAILLAVLAVGHFLFAVVNFGYVERLPENLDVLIERLSASLAAASLVWGANSHVQKKPWGGIVLVGGFVFLAGMVTSVLSGASTPSMFQVVIPIFTLGIVRLLIERARPSGATSRTPGRP